MKQAIQIIALLFFCTIQSIHAQVVTCDPVFPAASDAVVITFNADQGDAGLENYSGGDIYAHTGVITDKSTGSTDWKYVISDWSVNLDKAKLTKVSTNVYTLTISGSIRDFYGVPTSEKILKLAFVFRNSTGTVTGRDDNGADIFYDVIEAGEFQMRIVSPAKYTSLVYSGEVFEVKSAASTCDSLILFSNGSRIKTVTTNSLSTYVSVPSSGLYKLVARAWNNLVMAEDSAYYFVRHSVVTEDVPAGLSPGVNITGDNSAAFVLYAPGKSSVYVLGDFNDWVYCEEGYMKKSTDGNYFWLEVEGLDPDIEYSFQYRIDESIDIPDPYATKILDPWNDSYITEDTYPDLKAYPDGFASGLVSVFQTRPEEYQWKNNSFTAVDNDKLVIYELLVRDFVAAHDFSTICDSLDYFSRLGVNAIEFMPVNEFDGNSSWGYNPAMYLAVDKYYGPANTFKEVIDSCHSRGIAVIMDMVLNHAYGNNPLVKMYFNSTTNKPASNNPWFNVDSPNTSYSYGYDFNHESLATQAFVDSVCSFWINEFKIDGIRFDFTKGFTNTTGDGWAYDASRIAILERIGNVIWSYKPDASLILEHWTANTEEKELADYGFLIWGDGKYGYQNASKGSSSDFSEASWKSLGWNEPGVVDYMESHDEERIMFMNLNEGASLGSYDIQDFSTAIKRIKLDAAFFFSIPGPKMIWQFEEVGYDYSIDYNGRVGEKPIKWGYYQDDTRRNLYDNFSALIDLRSNNDVFSTENYTLYQSGKQKRLNLRGSDMDVVVLGNFDVQSGTVDPNFTTTGTWYEFFSGETLAVTSSNQNSSVSLEPGEYRLYTSKQVERPSFLLDIENPEAEKENEEVINVYPNPFSDETCINFSGDDAWQPHLIEILNYDGKTVRIITLPSGINMYTWDGTDNSGSMVAHGIYFIRITSGGVTSVKKVIKLDN